MASVVGSAALLLVAALASWCICVCGAPAGLPAHEEDLDEGVDDGDDEFHFVRLTHVQDNRRKREAEKKGEPNRPHKRDDDTETLCNGKQCTVDCAHQNYPGGVCIDEECWCFYYGLTPPYAASTRKIDKMASTTTGPTQQQRTQRKQH